MIRKNPLPQEWCGAHHIDDQEIAAVTRVLKAKSPFRFYGLDLQNETASFEREFAAYVGVKHGLAVSSGTAALQVALGAFGVEPGDEVIIPAYLWVSTVGAVVRAGAVPVLADVDATFSIDPTKLKFTKKTKVIITVHMGGVIGRVRELVSLARQNGVKVLEDCAQAAGCTQHGVSAGAFGDMAIYSFQLNKHMTSGEGGMIVTDSEVLYQRASAIHDMGYPRLSTGRLDFSNSDLQLWGIGCRMSEVTAAIGRVQLGKLNMIVSRMRSSKYRILAGIRGVVNVTAREVIDPAGDAGSFIYLTFSTRPLSLAAIDRLRAEGIVAAQSGQYPIHMDGWGLHIYYNIPSLVNKRGWALKDSPHSYSKGTCPFLDDLLQRTIMLCVASTLTLADESDIIAGLKKACI